MVTEDLSFVELMDELCNYSRESSATGSKQQKFSPVIVSEGAVFRYVLDVYRTLRYAIPKNVKSEKVLELEAKLRKALAAVDSSVLREWEALKALEQVEELNSEAVQSAAGDAAPPMESNPAPIGYDDDVPESDTLQERIDGARERLAARNAEAAWLAAQPTGQLRQRLRRVGETTSRVLEGVLDKLLWMW